MNNLKDLTEKLNKLQNSPYRNIFTFETAEQEAEYNKELDKAIEKEAKAEIKKYLK